MRFILRRNALNCAAHRSLALLILGLAFFAASAEAQEPKDNDYTKQAELFLLQENFQGALEAAQQSIAEEPENPQGYLQAGRAQVGLGDYVAADASFDRAEELYPEFVPVLLSYREAGWVQAYNGAIAEYQANNQAGALANFEAGHAIYKGRPEAMLQLGSLYNQAGRADDAIAVYREAIELTTGPLLAQQDSSMLQGWADSEEIAASNLGQILAQNDRPEEAVAVYSAFLDRHPDDITSLSNLGAVLVMAEQPDSAMAIYDQILAREDLNAREYFVTGIGLYNVEAYDRAVVAFGKSTNLNPKNRDAQFNLTQTMYLASQFDDLYSEALKLIELDPNNQQAYVLAYQGLKETGREAEGTELIETADGLQFLVEVPTLQPVSGGGAILSGEIKNMTMDEGAPIVIRFHFTGITGEEVAMEEVSINAPAADATTPFQTEVGGETVVMGYWYEVVG